MRCGVVVCGGKLGLWILGGGRRCADERVFQVVMQVRLPGLITWYLPEIARQERRWEAEMQYYAIKGLQAAAQCFGHK